MPSATCVSIFESTMDMENAFIYVHCMASALVQSCAHDMCHSREIANTHNIAANLSASFFREKVNFDTDPTDCGVSHCLVHSAI